MPDDAQAPFALTICGIDELPQHCAVGVTHVLSILDPEHPDLSFDGFGSHQRLSLRFHDVIDPTEGFDLPEGEHVADLLAFGRSLETVERPVHLLVHCHAGISRSTAAAVLLIAQSQPARSERSIVDEIAALRVKAWPNLRMIELGDQLLGRDGRLVAAAQARHHAVAAANPHIARMMIGAGRGREVGDI